VAYANPAFATRHLGAEVGVAAIETKYATVAGFGKERLIDYRGALLMRFSASQSDHDIELDRGAGFDATQWSRLVIPAGHNLAGTTIEVYSGASSPAATLRGTFAGVGSGWLDLAFTAAADRYFRIEFTTAGTWELGELWITTRAETATGIVQGWRPPYRTPAERIEFPSREAVSLLATPRRRFLLEHRGLVEGSADELVYLGVIQTGVGKPFLFWEPSVGATPWIALLEQDGERTQDHPQPRTQVAYTYGLALREQLL